MDDLSRRVTCTGCLIGCGALILIFVLVLVGTAHWLTKKGTFQEETTILSSNSEFYVQMMLRSEDKILVDFFSGLAQEANRDNPVFKRFPFLEGWNQKKTRKDILKILPLKIEFTGRVLEEDFRGAVGFSVYNNAVSLIYGFISRALGKEGNSIDFQGRNYLRFIEGDEDFFISLEHSLLFMANSESAMRDLLENRNHPMTSHGLDSRFQGLDRGKPIYGFLVGRAINMDWWPQAQMSREQEELAREMFNQEHFSRIAFGIHLESDKNLAIRAHLDTIDGLHDHALETWIGEWSRQVFDQGGLDVTSRVETTDRGYSLHVNLTGFEKMVPTHQTIKF